MWRRFLAFIKPRPVEGAPAPAVEAPAPTIPVLAVGDKEPPAGAVPPAAIQMVAQFEGYRAEAYLCPARVWTIGYGTTRWGNGQPVTKGDGPVTEEAARRLLRNDLADAARAVDTLVDTELTEHQRAALISFVHNCGRGAFARSTLLMHVNAGRMDSAAAEFPRWNMGGGRVLPGLVRRRAAEARLFAGRA